MRRRSLIEPSVDATNPFTNPGQGGSFNYPQLPSSLIFLSSRVSAFAQRIAGCESTNT